MPDENELGVQCPACTAVIPILFTELESDDPLICPECDFQLTFDVEPLKIIYKTWLRKLARGGPENPHLN